MGKIVGGILAIFLLLGAFASPIIEGIKGWRTVDTTEQYVVVTGGGETGDNVTLSYDLFQAALPEVIAITSTEETDTPAATAYVEATNALEVSGLTASETRTLTVNYYGETANAVMKAIGGFLAVLIIGGLVGLVLWDMAKHKK